MVRERRWPARSRSFSILLLLTPSLPWALTASASEFQADLFRLEKGNVRRSTSNFSQKGIATKLNCKKRTLQQPKDGLWPRRGGASRELACESTGLADGMLAKILSPQDSAPRRAKSVTFEHQPARPSDAPSESSEWAVLGEVVDMQMPASAVVADSRSHRAEAAPSPPPRDIADTDTPLHRRRRSGSRRRIGQPSSFVVASSLASAAFNDAQEGESALFVEDKEMETSILLELARLRFQIAQSHKALESERTERTSAPMTPSEAEQVELRRRSLFGAPPIAAVSTSLPVSSQQPVSVEVSNASDADSGLLCIKPNKAAVSASWPAPQPSGTSPIDPAPLPGDDAGEAMAGPEWLALQGHHLERGWAKVRTAWQSSVEHSQGAAGHAVDALHRSLEAARPVVERSTTAAMDALDHSASATQRALDHGWQTTVEVTGTGAAVEIAQPALAQAAIATDAAGVAAIATDAVGVAASAINAPGATDAAGVAASVTDAAGVAASITREAFEMGVEATQGMTHATVGVTHAAAASSSEAVDNGWQHATCEATQAVVEACTRNPGASGSAGHEYALIDAGAAIADDAPTDAFTRSTSAAKVALETSAAATRDALGVGLELTRVVALAPVALAAVATIKLSQTIGSGIGSGLEATRDAADHVIIVAGDEILRQVKASSSALSKGFTATSDAVASLAPQHAAAQAAAQEGRVGEEDVDFAADFGGDASTPPESTRQGRRSPPLDSGLPGSMPPMAARQLDNEFAAAEATPRGLGIQPPLPRRLTLAELLAVEEEEARVVEGRAAAAKAAEETARVEREKRAGAAGRTHGKPTGAWAAARKLYHGGAGGAGGNGMGGGTRGYQPLAEALRSKDAQLVDILRRKRASTAAVEGASPPPADAPAGPSTQAFEPLAAQGAPWTGDREGYNDAAVPIESMLHGQMGWVEEAMRHREDDDDGIVEASEPIPSSTQSSRHLARIRTAKMLGGTSPPLVRSPDHVGRPVPKGRPYIRAPSFARPPAAMPTAMRTAAQDSPFTLADFADNYGLELPQTPPPPEAPTRRSRIRSLWRMLPRSLSLPGRHASGGDTPSKPPRRAWSGVFRRSSSRQHVDSTDDTIMRT